MPNKIEVSTLIKDDLTGACLTQVQGQRLSETDQKLRFLTSSGKALPFELKPENQQALQGILEKHHITTLELRHCIINGERVSDQDARMQEIAAFMGKIFTGSQYRPYSYSKAAIRPNAIAALPSFDRRRQTPRIQGLTGLNEKEVGEILRKQDTEGEDDLLERQINFFKRRYVFEALIKLIKEVDESLVQGTDSFVPDFHLRYSKLTCSQYPLAKDFVEKRYTDLQEIVGGVLVPKWFGLAKEQQPLNKEELSYLKEVALAGVDNRQAYLDSQLREPKLKKESLTHFILLLTAHLEDDNYEDLLDLQHLAQVFGKSDSLAALQGKLREISPKLVEFLEEEVEDAELAPFSEWKKGREPYYQPLLDQVVSLGNDIIQPIFEKIAEEKALLEIARNIPPEEVDI